MFWENEFFMGDLMSFKFKMSYRGIVYIAPDLSPVNSIQPLI